MRPYVVAKHAPIAKGTSIRAAPGGHHDRHGELAIRGRCGAILRKGLKQVSGRVWQAVQVLDPLPRRSQDNLTSIAKSQAIDLLQINFLQVALILYLLHQFEEDHLPFTDDPNVKDLLQHGLLRNGRHMCPAQHNDRLGESLAYRFSQFDGIQESRGGAGNAYNVWPVRPEFIH